MYMTQGFDLSSITTRHLCQSVYISTLQIAYHWHDIIVVLSFLNMLCKVNIWIKHPRIDLAIVCGVDIAILNH